jgi:hypothetical protein
MPCALPVNWDAIRIEFAHGVSIPELAKKYDISDGTLKARCSREKWVEMRPEFHATIATDAVLDAAKQGAKVAAQSWMERGESYRRMIFEKTSKLMEQATLAPPKNWKDADVADKMARRAAGLDNLETQVNTIIGIGSLEDGPMKADFEGEIVKDVSLLPDSNEGNPTG